MLDTPKAEQSLDILLIENNPGGVHLAVHALKESASPSHLVILRDAAEAQQFLGRSGPYACAPAPDLIIIDLDPPSGSSLKLLDMIGQEPGLEGTPVILLSTTGQGPELFQTCSHPAKGRASKSIDLQRFAQIVESIVLWFALAQPSVEGQWGGLSAWNGRSN